MAVLAESFNKALANIEPQRKEPGDDAKCAQAAQKEVREVLLDDSKLSSWGIDPVLIGSYARHVSIRRVKDVDVFGRIVGFPDSLYPGDALDAFETTLCAEYGTRCAPQTRSFKVDFEFDLSVDVVPARPYEAIWQIPRRPTCEPGGSGPTRCRRRLKTDPLSTSQS
jgi:tRNA nucleotidyltransferase (CCA-adding enzyme)